MRLRNSVDGKRRISQNWEENEQPNDGKKAKERCDGACTGHEGDVEIRNKGDYANNNTKPGGTLDETKADKRANNGVTSRSVTRKGVNPDASWTVKEITKNSLRMRLMKMLHTGVKNNERSRAHGTIRIKHLICLTI